MVEVYVSTDVESDGPIPGLHSMLSFASAAYLADKTLVGTFSANLEFLPGASGDAKTMEFWAEYPDEWVECRRDVQSPEAAINKYVNWLKSLPGEPVFAAYPLGFDFSFIYWYLMRFAGDNPFSRRGIDIRTYAMAVLKRDYNECSKEHMPSEWFEYVPRKHVALDDAISQGLLFCNMMRYHLNGTSS